jgi:hypothetical protein
MNVQIKTLLAASAATAILAGAAGVAHAQEAAAPAAAPAAPPATWASTIKYSGHVEAGMTLNPDSPSDAINFGHLFTDKANQVVLNSVALTAERDPDTSSKTIDIGFKLQGAYGSDSRYTQAIGEFNRTTDSRYTFDIVEAKLLAHVPYLTAGGIEVTAGEFATLEGAEVMDPTGNFFYSKSYLFNFGIPLKHLGVMTETHLNPLVDLYLGATSGVNTTVDSQGGANDNKIHFHGGIGLNFKNVTVLATTHIGPEDYTFIPGHAPSGTSSNRYLNDAVVTWKINDKLTSTTDFNYIYDEGVTVGEKGPRTSKGGGVATWLAYTLTPTVTLGARAEVWVDNNNFFVAEYPGATDFINFEGGYAPSIAYSLPLGKSTTYSEVTVGLNWKPPGLPKLIDGTTFRPEVRYDRVLNGGETPYDVFTKKYQVTIGVDMVAPINF